LPAVTDKEKAMPNVLKRLALAAALVAGASTVALAQVCGRRKDAVAIGA